MAEYDVYGNPILGDSRIKRLEWTGPLINRDEDRAVFGAVGFLNDGQHTAGIGCVYRERGRGNRVLYEAVRYEWQDQTYPLKEHAIFAARKEVQGVLEYDKSMAEDVPSTGIDPDTKASSPEQAVDVVKSQLEPSRGSARERVMALLSRIAKGRPSSDRNTEKGRSQNWPSR